MNTLPDLPVFFDANFGSTNEQYELTDAEAHHALHVVRLQKNDDLIVGNGKGTLWKARVSETSRNSLFYSPTEVLQTFNTSPFRTSIACGILKTTQRMETMVEKLVEIGVKEIIFYSSTRTGKHKGSQSRLEKVAIAAMKQSRKAFLPSIRITTIQDLVADTTPNKFLASCLEPCPPHLQHFETKGETLVVIGPEGDFTNQEIESFEHNGFTLCSLGSERLRSETASVYALICQQLKDLD